MTELLGKTEKKEERRLDMCRTASSIKGFRGNLHSPCSLVSFKFFSFILIVKIKPRDSLPLSYIPLFPRKYRLLGITGHFFGLHVFL